MLGIHSGHEQCTQGALAACMVKALPVLTAAQHCPALHKHIVLVSYFAKNKRVHVSADSNSNQAHWPSLQATLVILQDSAALL